MKLIIAGNYIADIHEEAFDKAFNKLGCSVIPFKYIKYFKNKLDLDSPKKYSLSEIVIRFQNKFKFGRIINRLNNELLELAINEKPDLIFITRGDYLFPKTIDKLKEISKVFAYNNDDPFSDKYPSYFWRHFLKSIHLYDHIFYYRIKNKNDYLSMNYYKTSLLRSYYIAEKNFYIDEIEKVIDVIFIGHFENDNRDDYLLYLISNGINIRIYGTNWLASNYYQKLKKSDYELLPIRGKRYNEMLNKSKIALVFLSKLNNDTYTRRCFEILSTKTFMLSEYTDDLNSLFQQGKEADYFNNKEELLEKIIFYLSNETKRNAIAASGYAKLQANNHEITDRAQQVLNIFKKLNEDD